MVSHPSVPARGGCRWAVTRDGLTYVFETEDEMRASLNSRASRAERVDSAIQQLEELACAEANAATLYTCEAAFARPVGFARTDIQLVE